MLDALATNLHRSLPLLDVCLDKSSPLSLILFLLSSSYHLTNLQTTLNTNCMKDTKKRIEKSLETLRPGEVVMVVAKRLEQDPGEFLAKNFARIGWESVKSGAVKAKDLAVAAVQFSKKSKEDSSEIAWDKLQIDPSTLQFGGLLLGKRAGDRLEELETKLSKQLELAKRNLSQKSAEEEKEEEEEQREKEEEDKKRRRRSSRKEKEDKREARRKKNLKNAIDSMLDGRRKKIR